MTSWHIWVELYKEKSLKLKTVEMYICHLLVSSEKKFSCYVKYMHFLRTTHFIIQLALLKVCCTDL